MFMQIAQYPVRVDALGKRAQAINQIAISAWNAENLGKCHNIRPVAGDRMSPRKQPFTIRARDFRADMIRTITHKQATPRIVTDVRRLILYLVRIARDTYVRNTVDRRDAVGFRKAARITDELMAPDVELIKWLFVHDFRLAVLCNDPLHCIRIGNVGSRNIPSEMNPVADGITGDSRFHCEMEIILMTPRIKSQ